MKLLSAFLLAASLVFSESSLLAAALDEYCEYFWSGNEEQLYLNLNLFEDLEFEDCYSTEDLFNGQSCQVTAKPKEGVVVYSSKGYELKEILISAALNNGDNPNRVAYVVISKCLYHGINEEGDLITESEASQDKGELRNPAIDLSQDPEFFTINDDMNEGVISFKNSFEYSYLQ